MQYIFATRSSSQTVNILLRLQNLRAVYFLMEISKLILKSRSFISGKYLQKFSAYWRFFTKLQM